MNVHWMQRVYNKIKTAGYTEEQEDLIIQGISENLHCFWRKNNLWTDYRKNISSSVPSPSTMAEPVLWCGLTVQLDDNGQKPTTKQTQEFLKAKKSDIFQILQISQIILTQQSILFVSYNKTEGREETAFADVHSF